MPKAQLLGSLIVLGLAAAVTQEFEDRCLLPKAMGLPRFLLYAVFSLPSLLATPCVAVSPPDSLGAAAAGMAVRPFGDGLGLGLSRASVAGVSDTLASGAPRLPDLAPGGLYSIDPTAGRAAILASGGPGVGVEYGVVSRSGVVDSGDFWGGDQYCPGDSGGVAVAAGWV